MMFFAASLLLLTGSLSFCHAVEVIDSSNPFDSMLIFPGKNQEKVKEYFTKSRGIFFYDRQRLLESTGSIQFSTSGNSTKKQATGGSDSSVTVLGIPIQDGSEGGRINKTCILRRIYVCERQVRQPYQTFCIRSSIFVPCTRFRYVTVNSTCERQYIDCCEGHKLGETGYCEAVSAGNMCGDHLRTNQSGTLTSPQHPGEYLSGLRCEWSIKGPPGTRIIMTFSDLDMEEPLHACNLKIGHCFDYCNFDWLQIQGLSGGVRTKSVCGETRPKTSYLSSSNQVNLTFISDESNAGRGFKMIYDIVPLSDIVPQHRCGNGRVWKLCHRNCALTCDSLAPKTFGVWNICIKTKLSESDPRDDVTGDGTNQLVDVDHLNDITCKPGCVCPEDRPIWHRNRCVKIEDCSQSRFKCGFPIEKPTPKIIGGKTADDGKWPWMVQITTNAMYTDCGATLVCSDWVITAAHCFLDKNTWSMPRVIDKQAYWFHLGKYWKFSQLDGRKFESFRAKKIVVHPQYNFDTDHNDIALVQLDGFVEDIDSIRPICLPENMNMNIWNEGIMNRTTNARPQFNDICMVAGWGSTRYIGPNSDKLKELRMPIKPATQCRSYKSYAWRKMICAGGEINEDTCKGDSGGPFMCKRNKRWFLDGITSFGDDCGTSKPGGYTRVGNYIPWIRVNLGPNCGRPT